MKRIERCNVVVEVNGEERTLGHIDTVVLAVGVKSNNILAQYLMEQLPGIELLIIGDAANPGNIQQAVWSGLNSGFEI